MSIQVDDFVIDLFCHFKRSVKRKTSLSEYMEFPNTEVKEVIKHVSACWLSFVKSLERPLMQWDALESYFLSELAYNDANTKYDDKLKRKIYFGYEINDPLAKLYVLFVQSYMPSFDTYKASLQSEEFLFTF